MVHRLNHWWLAPLGSGVFCVSFFYKFTKTKQDEAPPSHVHGKICPKAVSFGKNFVLLVHFWDTLYIPQALEMGQPIKKLWWGFKIKKKNTFPRHWQLKNKTFHGIWKIFPRQGLEMGQQLWWRGSIPTRGKLSARSGSSFRLSRWAQIQIQDMRWAQIQIQDMRWAQIYIEDKSWAQTQI